MIASVFCRRLPISFFALGERPKGASRDALVLDFRQGESSPAHGAPSSFPRGSHRMASSGSDGGLGAPTAWPALEQVAVVQQAVQHGADHGEGRLFCRTLPLLGQWRVEVSPREQRTGDVFLHLIQAADTTVARVVESRLVRKAELVGVRFQYGENEWEVLFGTGGEASGHITLRRNGAVRASKELTSEVMSRAGLYGASGA